MLGVIILTVTIALFISHEHVNPSNSVLLNRGEGDKDIINQWLPSALSGIALGFFASRLSAKIKGEHFLPRHMSEGAFPASFIVGLGALACHEFIELAVSHEGGLTAWAPMLCLTFFFGILARYGQEMASGGKPSIYPILATLLFTGKFLAESLYNGPVPQSIPEAVNVAQELTIKAAKKASKKLKKVAKAAATIEVSQPELPTQDVILEQLPKLIILAGALILIVRFVEGRKVIPQGAFTGATPWGIMIGGCTVVAHAIYRLAVKHPEAHPDDFAALVSVCVAAGALANFGVKLQK